MVFRFHCRQNILLWTFSWTVNTIAGAVHEVSKQLSLMLQREKKRQILLYFLSQNAVKYIQVFVP